VTWFVLCTHVSQSDDDSVYHLHSLPLPFYTISNVDETIINRHDAPSCLLADERRSALFVPYHFHYLDPLVKRKDSFVRSVSFGVPAHVVVPPNCGQQNDGIDEVVNSVCTDTMDPLNRNHTTACVKPSRAQPRVCIVDVDSPYFVPLTCTREPSFFILSCLRHSTLTVSYQPRCLQFDNMVGDLPNRNRPHVVLRSASLAVRRSFAPPFICHS
jgi:hypothetical protein